MVELMLAIALGLVIFLGLVRQYSGGRAAQLQLQAQADLQDAGFYALEFLRRSAVSAGYLGCNGGNVRLHNTLNGRWSDLFEFDLTRPIQGFDYQGDRKSKTLEDWSPSLAELPRQTGAGTVNALAGGTGIRTDGLAAGADLLVFRRVGTPAWPVASAIAPDAHPLTIDLGHDNLEAGDVALISNCQQAAMFRITAMAPTAGGMLLMRQPGTGLYDNALDRQLSLAGLSYGGDAGPEGAAVGPVVTEIYFVADGAGQGVLSLWRRSGPNRPVELVDGIVDMQAWLGVDFDLQDGRDGPNGYIRFNELEESHRVRSISLTVTVLQGSLTRQFERTIALRNAG